MSLAEQLAQLANPTPVFIDPEDDVDFETSAKVADFHLPSFHDDNDAIDDGSKSVLRLQNIPMLDAVDSRYAGKKTSRRQLQKMSLSSRTVLAGKGISDDEIGENPSEDDCLESEDETETLQKFQAQLEISALAKSAHFDEEATDASVITETSITSGEDDEMDVIIDDEAEKHDPFEDNAVQTFSKINLNEDAEKGKAVKAQLRLWDVLLECRIKLQKVLLAANQLPQHDVWQSFSERGGKNYDEAAKSSQRSVKGLLDSLIELQASLLTKNSETRKMLKTGNVKRRNGSDEEITSDTECKEDTDSDGGEEEVGFKRKLKVCDYSESLKKRHKELEYFRNSTIQKWSDKTKVSSGKVNKSFSSFEQSALKQIEQILQDEDRLVRRTQLKRSSYELLGKNLALEIENGQGQTVSGQEAVLKQDSHLKDHDMEIFDDNDFYHQLLRELIERKTVDLQDPVALGRQWLEIQRLRSKMKKKVDTRASKGRKIRYDVHSKLTNFMAPVEGCAMAEESRNDLFSSLFGRRRPNADPHV